MSLNVKCPECGKMLTAHSGEQEVACNCHLYCSYGNKPTDCSVSQVTTNRRFNWPSGLHVGDAEDDSTRPTHTYYCSTHSVYYDKVAQIIEVDWSQTGRRADPDYRYFGEDTF